MSPRRHCVNAGVSPADERLSLSGSVAAGDPSGDLDRVGYPFHRVVKQPARDTDLAREAVATQGRGGDERKDERAVGFHGAFRVTAGD